MKYLYVDTSSNFLYSGIVENNKILAEIKEEFGQNLSEVALPKIVELFDKTNLKAKDINKIIVVNGPGSFTGIRIGITIAKVYAWSLNIPITTISSLEAMAISSENEKLHIPMINARRGYVYGAIYDSSYKEILKPQHIELDKLMKYLNDKEDYEIISNDNFDDEIKRERYDPSILKIVNYFKDKETINPHSVNPEYLKLIIEINKNNIDLINNSFISKEYILNELENNPFAKILILKENDEIVAYVYYSDIYERAEINQIEVNKIHRNCGKGNFLLNYMINLLKKNITLEVKEDNYSAIKLYEKNKFEKKAIMKGYYNGIDGILYERKNEKDSSN